MWHATHWKVDASWSGKTSTLSSICCSPRRSCRSLETLVKICYSKFLESYIKVWWRTRSPSWLLVSVLSCWRSFCLIKDVGNVVVVSPHIVFQVVLKYFVLLLSWPHIRDRKYLTMSNLFAIARMKLTIKKDRILFQLSQEFADADRLDKTSSTVKILSPLLPGFVQRRQAQRRQGDSRRGSGSRRGAGWPKRSGRWPRPYPLVGKGWCLFLRDGTWNNWKLGSVLSYHYTEA